MMQQLSLKLLKITLQENLTLTRLSFDNKPNQEIGNGFFQLAGLFRGLARDNRCECWERIQILPNENKQNKNGNDY